MINHFHSHKFNSSFQSHAFIHSPHLNTFKNSHSIAYFNNTLSTTLFNQSPSIAHIKRLPFTYSPSISSQQILPSFTQSPLLTHIQPLTAINHLQLFSSNIHLHQQTFNHYPLTTFLKTSYSTTSINQSSLIVPLHQLQFIHSLSLTRFQTLPLNQSPSISVNQSLFNISLATFSSIHHLQSVNFNHYPALFHLRTLPFTFSFSFTSQKILHFFTQSPSFTHIPEFH